MKKEVCIDARMLLLGGIGTYIRNLLPGLNAAFQLKLIVHPDIVEKEKWLQGYDLIFSSAGIYSIREQIELPMRIPHVDLSFLRITTSLSPQSVLREGSSPFMTCFI